MKIVIVVEGQTEKAFLPTLRKFLKNRLMGRMPKIALHVYDGRVPKDVKLQRVVENHLNNGADAVIALTDVYTGTNDFVDAADAKAKMRRWVGDNPRFYPHVAQYDFEAWLLPFWSTIQQLAKHNLGPPTGNPELVDHGKPPAHRIKEIFERGGRRDSYVKPRDAVRILEKNDLLISANACPELKALLNTILTLCAGDVIV